MAGALRLLARPDLQLDLRLHSSEKGPLVAMGAAAGERGVLLAKRAEQISTRRIKTKREAREGVVAESARMVAARFNDAGEPLRVEQIFRPECAAGEALVRVWRGRSLWVRHPYRGGGITPTSYRPIVLGHETAGTVAQVAADVSGWVPGDGSPSSS